jgi:predicted RNA binding protein with dsRBD fold (UPF0201 family)
MSEIQVHLETPVNPTEDPDKVSRAVRNLFPDARLNTVETDERQSKLEATMTRLEDLEKIRSLLRQEVIRDAARKVLFQGLSGSAIVVHLNKQAAFAGKASFCDRYDESPLGPITLTITTDNPDQLVDWLAPSSRGKQRSET